MICLHKNNFIFSFFCYYLSAVAYMGLCRLIGVIFKDLDLGFSLMIFLLFNLSCHENNSIFLQSYDFNNQNLQQTAYKSFAQLIYTPNKMYSLTDLQQNLKSLITELQQIQSTISTPQKRKLANQKSMLHKIPKGILLSLVCKYLTMHQIRYLSNVCSQMKKRIYSPLGWKIIGRIKTPYPVKVVCLKSELKDKIKRASMGDNIGLGLDQDDDEKYIAKERNKYKAMLLTKYSSYLQSKQKYEAGHDKVRVEKAHLLRIKQQINYLDGVRQELDEQNKLNKQKLKALSQGFSAKIKDMDELNDSLIKQRTKLQNQKQALAGKIREYQHEIQNIKQDSEKSKQILRRLKNYLLYKQL